MKSAPKRSFTLPQILRTPLTVLKSFSWEAERSLRVLHKPPTWLASASSPSHLSKPYSEDPSLPLLLLVVSYDHLPHNGCEKTTPTQLGNDPQLGVPFLALWESVLDGHTYHFLPFPLHRDRKFCHLLLRNPYYLTFPSNRLPAQKHVSSKMGFYCNQCNKTSWDSGFQLWCKNKERLDIYNELMAQTNKQTNKTMRETQSKIFLSKYNQDS